MSGLRSDSDGLRYPERSPAGSGRLISDGGLQLVGGYCTTCERGSSLFQLPGVRTLRSTSSRLGSAEQLPAPA